MLRLLLLDGMFLRDWSMLSRGLVSNVGKDNKNDERRAAAGEEHDEEGSEGSLDCRGHHCAYRYLITGIVTKAID